MRRWLAVLGLVAGCGGAATGMGSDGGRPPVVDAAMPGGDATVSDGGGPGVDGAVGDAATAPSCSDGVQNGDESDVDCGGSCAPCLLGRSCAATSDCIHPGACTSGRCACPPPPANLITSYSFAGHGDGNPFFVLSDSGKVVAIPLPPAPMGQLSHQLDWGETPAADSPSPALLEMSVNLCPGYIDTDTTNYCNIHTTQTSFNSLVYFSRLGPPFTTVGQVTAKGYCWAPESAGTFYINSRWTYMDCAGGASPPCGFFVQQDPGPY